MPCLDQKRLVLRDQVFELLYFMIGKAKILGKRNGL